MGFVPWDILKYLKTVTQQNLNQNRKSLAHWSVAHVGSNDEKKLKVDGLSLSPLQHHTVCYGWVIGLYA